MMGMVTMVDVDPMELVYSLVGYPDETEWIEFKEGNSEPERIGRDISALANSAAFHRRDYAYKLWGVADSTHALVGTSFNHLGKKAKGNQALMLWLRTQLSSNANYEFERIEHGDQAFVVLKIRAASGQPVYFDEAAYIREGSSTTRLIPGSAKEAELWRRLQSNDYETRAAAEDLSFDEVAELLDLGTYFDLLHMRRPSSADGVALELCEQEIVKQQDNGRYTITNLGALVAAKRLSAFPGLRKRVIRVVRYAGAGNFDILDDTFFDKGYALALPEAERYIMASLPAEEVQEGAFRRVRSAFPQRAVRELLSNTVIHQDLCDTTSGPLVGVFSNRLEFLNPGATLMPCDRVLNARPKTRNNALVARLRQMDLCEEGGTGWDLAVAACEASHMPAPRIESEEPLGTKVTLFEGRAYDRMTRGERREAVYWHACLQYAQGDSMGNQSLRERFGLDASKKNTVAMSRLIKECVEAGLIKEEDEEAGAKYKRYIPAWA